jgi:CheY-like chemotaxis protein
VAETSKETPPVSTVLVYASDRTVRAQVRAALGRKIASDLPEIRIVEAATQPAVIKAADAGGIDLLVLDGEARPGGMGVCRQLKDEVYDCPPIMIITGRADDAWLATWSRAEAAVPHPIDPLTLPGVVGLDHRGLCRGLDDPDLRQVGGDLAAQSGSDLGPYGPVACVNQDGRDAWGFFACLSHVRIVSRSCRRSVSNRPRPLCPTVMPYTV